MILGVGTGYPFIKRGKRFALSFDGVDDRVSFGDVGHLGLDDFTIEAIVKLRGTGARLRIFDKASKYAFGISATQLSSWLNGWNDIPFNFTMGTIYKVAIKRTGVTSLSFYVDDVLISTIAIPSWDITPGGGLFMGSLGTSGAFLNGMIYTARIKRNNQLIAEWIFKNGQGSTLLDNSSNAANGSIVGATWVEV
jgi:hypothetical protein